MKKKQSTMSEVAAQAGVSIATVSRVMAGGSVSASAREKVEEAMRALGYRPSAGRGGSRISRGRDIAIVLSSQSSPYYAAMCEGMTAEAARSGYQLLSLQYPEGTGCEAIASDLLTLRPAGAVLAGFMVERCDGQEALRSCLGRLQQAMPLVAIGPPVAGIECPRLTSDPGACVRKSMAHLTNLGHRRIAFVGGDRTARFSVIRESTYRQEAERLGCRVNPLYAVQTGCDAPAGELGVSILLANLQRRDYPTAVLAINDLVALGVMKQLQRMGISIPKDMALVGCDNAFFAPYLTPSLTTVDLHPYEHGRSAMAELIMSISAGHPISFNQPFESSLIVRESCGASLGIRAFPEAGSPD